MKGSCRNCGAPEGEGHVSWCDLSSQNLETYEPGTLGPNHGHKGPDLINRPPHYAEGRKHEPIDVIEDWQLNYRLGQVVRYVSRAGRKDDRLSDLRKASWYLLREIEKLIKEK